MKATKSSDTETPRGNGAVPPDAADLAGIFDQTEAGDDPLTTETQSYVPVGRPKDFFMTCPDRAYRQSCDLVTIKSENVVGVQFYLVDKPMKGKIEDARPCVLVTVVDRSGQPRLWPIPSPRSDERDNAAWSSSRAGAREGMTRWVKLRWKGKAFALTAADAGYAPPPDFSKLPSFEELVHLAFGKNGIIRDESHSAYRELVGKAEKPADGDAADLL
jgi:hypothetical protein